jgi:hypothetical protein
MLYHMPAENPRAIKLIFCTIDYVHETWGQEKKSMEITPGVSSPQYGEIAGFCFVFLFFICAITSTGRTDRPILTLHISNDAVPPKEVQFGGHSDNQFIKGSIPSWFAGSGKTHKHFQAYSHEGLTSKHQIISNYMACDRKKILLTKIWMTMY